MIDSAEKEGKITPGKVGQAWCLLVYLVLQLRAVQILDTHVLGTCMPKRCSVATSRMSAATCTQRVLQQLHMHQNRYVWVAATVQLGKQHG